MSENDFKQIKETYGSGKNIGMINYREFVNGLHENGKNSRYSSTVIILNIVLDLLSD